MVEVIADIVMPSAFVLPELSGADEHPQISGSMWLSGGFVYYQTGQAVKVLSGCAVP